MNARLEFLEKLDEQCRQLELDSSGNMKWENGRAIRDFAVRLKRGDESAWQAFLDYLADRRELAWALFSLFERWEWLSAAIDQENEELVYRIELPGLDEVDKSQLLKLLRATPETKDERPKPGKPSKVMYIEEKPGLAGHARIGRVTFSESRRTIYYRGRSLQSLNGNGYKANYFNIESGLEYWISNCKKNGNDTLYPGTIEIDDDAREEYWQEIRKQPENVHVKQIRSEGKYSKRRPS